MKLLAYRVFDPVKDELTAEAKAKIPADLMPRIAKRAYELYEARSHQSDPAVRDWEQAEREIRKDNAPAEPKSEP